MRTLNRARDAFEALRPHGWRDAEAAYVKDPTLARDAAKGQLTRAIRALKLETELRTAPRARADRFVERWQQLPSPLNSASPSTARAGASPRSTAGSETRSGGGRKKNRGRDEAGSVERLQGGKRGSGSQP